MSTFLSLVKKKEAILSIIPAPSDTLHPDEKYLQGDPLVDEADE